MNDFQNKCYIQDVLDVLLAYSAFSLFPMTSQSPVEYDVIIRKIPKIFNKIAIKIEFAQN